MVEIDKRQGANLPHWTVAAATYAVTFRLADSLPIHRLTQWKSELGILGLKRARRPEAITLAEEKRLAYLLSERTQAFLDSGAGACLLRKPGVAKTVVDALRHFNGERYAILAWCVMPNHVHVVVRPVGKHTLDSVLHAWKSFTANRIRKLLGIQGPIWQRESYDHWIRDAQDYRHAVQYVLENPAKAGLKNWAWVGTVFEGTREEDGANALRSPEGA